MKFRFQVIAFDADLFKISLIAQEGPFLTKNIHVDLEGASLEGASTFIHLRYFYEYSSWGYFLMNTYFTMFSGGRVGFTVTEKNHGETAYVTGLKGAVELNVVRYDLAILAYVDTMDFRADQRFEERIKRSYDLIDQHKRQLHEMEREAYLDYKRHDQNNQQKLQCELGK